MTPFEDTLGSLAGDESESGDSAPAVRSIIVATFSCSICSGLIQGSK